MVEEDRNSYADKVRSSSSVMMSKGSHHSVGAFLIIKPGV